MNNGKLWLEEEQREFGEETNTELSGLKRAREDFSS